MKIDPAELRRHYASLSDEALDDLNPAELSDVARPIYEEELARRGVSPGEENESSAEPAPDWLEDAACACAFTLRTATYNVPTASTARAALVAAGIPCHVTMSRDDPPKVDPAPQFSLRLMVPGALALHASSVLDEEIFNEDQEHEFHLVCPNIRKFDRKEYLATALSRSKRK